MVLSERIDSTSTRRFSFLACASAFPVGVVGALGSDVVGGAVGGGAGLWAIAGALISESGSVRAATRAARRHVQRDKPDDVRDVVTRAFHL
ncbi:hypothetical protein GCM10009525_70890 [Streptosporangium amethystogenes subsp. fukuiense]